MGSSNLNHLNKLQMHFRTLIISSSNETKRESSSVITRFTAEQNIAQGQRYPPLGEITLKEIIKSKIKVGNLLMDYCATYNFCIYYVTSLCIYHMK